ncbi:hypothetical protein ABTF50_21415, partial [Acinetobacter baumannii]
KIMKALYKGFIAAAVLSLIALYPVTNWVLADAANGVSGMAREVGAGAKVFTGLKLYLCGVAGLVVTGLIIWATEYYTGTD